VLDFVANHVSRRHPAFVAAQQNATSPYRDWFFFRRHPDEYESFYDIPDQPIVNTDHPAMREYLIGAARHWLDLGCDGFRLDHAHGATHAFWSAFRTATRAVKTDAATFGEITDTPTLMRSFTGRMDGVLDFHLLELLRGFFAFQSITASQFDRALRQHFAYFAEALVLPSFLDNHDMNRFLWSSGGETRRLKLAALCQFTLPQPPIVYYGTEVGLSQRQAVGRLEEARLPMLWDTAQDHALLNFYRDLIALRRQTTDVWSLPRATVLVDDARGLYVYRCGAYIVYLNNSGAPVTVECQTAEPVLTTDAAVALHAHQLHLPPFAGAVCGSI
jgi:glycosidase